MQMRFTLRCIECIAISVLQEQQYRESIVDEERPGWHVVAMSDATIATVGAFVQSNRRASISDIVWHCSGIS